MPDLDGSNVMWANLKTTPATLILPFFIQNARKMRMITQKKHWPESKRFA